MKRLLLLLLLSGSAFAEPVYLSCRVQNKLEGSATPTSSLVLSENGVRKCLLIVNKGSSGTIYASIDGVQGVTTNGVPIPAGGNWNPTVPPVNAVYLTTQSGTNSYIVLEGK